MADHTNDTHVYRSERKRGISIAVAAVISAAFALIGFMISEVLPYVSEESLVPVLFIAIPLAVIVLATRGLLVYFTHTPTLTLTPTHLLIDSGPDLLMGRPQRIALDRIYKIHLLVQPEDFDPPHTLSASSDGVVRVNLLLIYRAPERRSVHTECAVEIRAIPGGADLLREIIRRTGPQISVAINPFNPSWSWNARRTASWAQWKIDIAGGWKIDPHDFRIEGPPRLPEAREESEENEKSVGGAASIWGPKREVTLDREKLLPPANENADVEGESPSSSA